MKFFYLFLGFVLLMAFVIGNQSFVLERDVPSVLNPSFVQMVSDCGKLDLIDRSSKNYNPSALTDGSLDDCYSTPAPPNAFDDLLVFIKNRRESVWH